MTNWIDWSGGECPVSPDTRVEVRWRNDATIIGLADEFAWFHDWHDAESDIIRYRVVGESPDIASKADGDLGLIARTLWDAYQATGLTSEPAKGISWDTILANRETNRGAASYYEMGMAEAKAVAALFASKADSLTDNTIALKERHDELLALVNLEYERHEKDAKLANFNRCGCDFCTNARAAISKAEGRTP